MPATEVTSFEVRPGMQEAFKQSIDKVLPILQRQAGYLGHDGGFALEQPLRFWLIVQWRQLQDHTEGFRGSADFKQFVAAFRPHLARPAQVEHFVR